MSAEQSLYQALREYAASAVYPCHMPGHKRNPAGGEMAEFFDIDITEIEGFDDLHHAEGILKKAQERANRFYGADETFFLVNGSTGGILAAVMAAASPGEEILIARNCHRSVYHAALMQNLKVHYYQPQRIREYDICDGVSAEGIGKLLDEHPAIRAVVITSPTYEGILSNVEKIAAAVHERGKILIVDEAHGAHLGLFEDIGSAGTIAGEGRGVYGAISAGADLVIHSLHKTLPSLTQTALLHVNGNRADRDRLRSYLAMVQSSSPSYVLMAGMDACIRYLEQKGRERFSFYRENRNLFLQNTVNLRSLRIGKMTDVSENGYALLDWDMGKILISVKDTDMTGKQLADVLRDDYQIELEMAAATYGLALMTLMDTAEGWQRLADALLQIDDRIEKERGGEQAQRKSKNAGHGLAQESGAAAACTAQAGFPEAVMTFAQAFHSESEEVLMREAAGRISAGFINLYPPGIPLAAPGEKLTQALLDEVRLCLKKGFTVHGVSSAGGIRVIVEIR